MTPDEHRYYASHGVESDPGDLRGLLDVLPKDPAGILGAVGGLVLHTAFVEPLGAVCPPDWDHPVGRRIFAMTPEVSASSKVLAMNQGLYNGFLAAGLIWGLLAGRRDVTVFFLSCVLVAGLFGGITAKTSILLTQALPGLIALVCVLAASRAGGHRRR